MPFLPILTALAQEDQSGGGLQTFIDSAARTPLSQVVAGVALLSVLRLGIAPYLRRTPVHQRFFGYGIARLLNEILDAVIYAGVFVFMIIRPFGVQAFLIPSGSMWPTLYVHDFIVANKAIYRYTDPKVDDVVVFRPPKEATFNNPEQLDSNGDVKVDFIKRCVGVPGDVVELRDGVLYRNGRQVPDPYRHYSLSLDHGQTFEELPEKEVARMPMASFKLVYWHNRVIPLNYTRSEANSSTSGYVGSDLIYEVAPPFVIPDQTDQLKAIAEKPAALPRGFYLMMGDNRNNSFDGRGWGLVPRDSIIGKAEFIWMPLSRMGRIK